MNSSSDNSASDIASTSASARSGALATTIGGRPVDRVDELIEMLHGVEWLNVTRRLITNGHADVLHGVEQQPEALILVLSGAWQDELKALAERPAQARPPAIIVGPNEDTDVLRLAMRAGARDYLSWPPDRGELVELLGQLRAESASSSAGSGAELISVINAKGGSGGTFVSCSLAHIMAARFQQKVALIDLDLQFGNLASYFDLPIKHSLQEVLDAADQLDLVALKGYMTSHPSTLDVLGNQDIEPQIITESDGPQLLALLELMSEGYDQLVMDLPRVLDHLTIQALEVSDKVLVVLQQNVVSIKDAKRLTDVMTDYLKVPPDRIIGVANRFDKDSEIGLNDIQNATGLQQIVSIPNDFSRVSESLDVGIPIYESFPKARISRAVATLAATLCGTDFREGRSVFESALHGLRGVLSHGQ